MLFPCRIFYACEFQGDICLFFPHFFYACDFTLYTYVLTCIKLFSAHLAHCTNFFTQARAISEVSGRVKLFAPVKRDSKDNDNEVSG